MHVSRWGAVLAVALGAVAGGCGGEDPAPDNPGAEVSATGDDDVTSSDPASAGGDEFSVMFTGEPLEMNARVELLVNEGERDVHLWITARTPGTDVMLIDLTFDGLENTFGEHSMQFSLPERGPHDANGSLGGQWYYSQSGQAELTLTADGRLEGYVDIGLARGDESQVEELVFEPSAVSAPLLINFSVPWVLSCHSQLAGHDVFQPGGDFCDRLDLTEL